MPAILIVIQSFCAAWTANTHNKQACVIQTVENIANTRQFQGNQAAVVDPRNSSTALSVFYKQNPYRRNI